MNRVIEAKYKLDSEVVVSVLDDICRIRDRRLAYVPVFWYEFITQSRGLQNLKDLVTDSINHSAYKVCLPNQKARY